MAEPLSKKLRPASFRGVPFQVESSDLGAGRRTQLHEYPQRDKPYVEDLGRAARDLSFTAFVVGVDYVDQASKLLGALEEPGPGELVHPWLGTLKVSIKEVGRVSFDAALGRASFALSFVESGELEFPGAAASTVVQSRLAAANIEAAAAADFAKNFTVTDWPDFVAEAASLDLASVLGAVAEGVPGLDALGYANSAAATLQGALGQLANPSALAGTVLGWLGIAPIVSSVTLTASRWATLAGAMVRLSGESRLAVAPAPTFTTPSRARADVNTAAIRALVRQGLLAQAVGASSLVPAAIHEETIALRDTLATALDAEALTASDAGYTALMGARGKVWSDLTTRARDSARLATLTLPETRPALAIAYDYYEDATRDADIVARNRIHHPGFVPPEPLRVLTR